MIEMLLAIAPIFLLIVLGHLLRRGGIPNIEFWDLNDKLVYWVLFPSLLFHKMATMKLSGDLLGEFSMVIYLGLLGAVVFALVAGRLFGLDRPTWTSVLQGCARHNTFIALAVAERVFGAEGLALAVMITALLIPITPLFDEGKLSTLREAIGEEKLQALLTDLSSESSKLLREIQDALAAGDLETVPHSTCLSITRTRSSNGSVTAMGLLIQIGGQSSTPIDRPAQSAIARNAPGCRFNRHQFFQF